MPALLKVLCISPLTLYGAADSDCVLDCKQGNFRWFSFFLTHWIFTILRGSSSYLPILQIRRPRPGEARDLPAIAGLVRDRAGILVFRQPDAKSAPLCLAPIPLWKYPCLPGLCVCEQALRVVPRRCVITYTQDVSF